MSVLSRAEILRQVELGAIRIDPFDPRWVGPNSVDLHLGDRLLVYDQAVIDAGEPPRTVEVPPQTRRDQRAWCLYPGRLYLGATREYTETHGFVPYLDGRSSLGRLGVFCHVTAGRGDNGWCGCWTVELAVVQPTWIYAGGRYFQVTYVTIEGDTHDLYKGRYLGDREPTGSGIAVDSDTR